MRPSRSLAGRALPAVFLLLALGCGDDAAVTRPEPGDDDEPPVEIADSLSIRAPSERRWLYANLGDTMSAGIRVDRVRDGDHVAAVGEPLRYRLLEGAASLADSTDTTDAHGRATLGIRVGDRPGAIVIQVEAPRTGDRAQVVGEGVRWDRFGPDYRDCADYGLQSHLEAIPGTENGYRSEVSPDGTRIVFEVFTDSTRDIALLDLTTGAVRRLVDSRDAGFPTWSPDGTRLAFVDLERDPDMIAIVDADSGTVLRFPSRHGTIWHTRWAPWGDDILFAWHRPGAFFEAWLQPVAGGLPRPLEVGPDGEPLGWHEELNWLPGGDAVIYTGGGSIRKVDLATGAVEELLWDREGGTRSFAYDPASHTLVYTSLRRSVRSLFLYRPDEDLWCRVTGTGAGGLSVLQPSWIEPGRSLVVASYDQLYRIVLPP